MLNFVMLHFLYLLKIQHVKNIVHRMNTRNSTTIEAAVEKDFNIKYVFHSKTSLMDFMIYNIM